MRTELCHSALQIFKCNLSLVRTSQHLSSKHCIRCKHHATPRPYISVGRLARNDTGYAVVRIPLNNKYMLRVICSESGRNGGNPGDGSSQDTDKASSTEQISKVKPTKKKPEPPQKYLSNVFITPLRAMREYLLTPNELSTLWNTKRRSPFENSPPITVYLRHDIERKAKEKYGSLENLEKEKDKARHQEDLYLRGLSTNRPMLFDYREKYPDSPKSDEHLEKQRKTIFKSGSGKVVLTAIFINSVNAVAKCIAWLYTGSHAMFAEAVHSLADTLNQCILAYGIHHSLKNPNQDHPYGFTNFRYVSSLISGVGIFCVGAGFAWYHGIAGILTKTELVDMNWAIMLLCGSFMSESVTLIMAMQNIRRKAKQTNQTAYEYVKRGTDPSVNVVLLEDSAAVVGVAVAATCMHISQITSNHIPDAVGSLIIGTLLAGVSAFIIRSNSIALLGRSIPEVSKRELTAVLEADMMIRSAHDVKATDMGANLIKFKAEVDIDGRLLTRKYLNELDLVELLTEMKALESPKEVEVFLLYHGEKIVELIGGEIDRIEKVLKATNPQVRHVDLEIL